MHAPPPPPGPADDTPADRRWQRAVDASLGGDPLDPGDLEHLSSHRGDSIATRRERQLLDDLRALALTADDALAPADADLVDAAVDRFLAARKAATPAPTDLVSTPRPTSPTDLASTPRPTSPTDLASTPRPTSPVDLASTPRPISTALDLATTTDLAATPTASASPPAPTDLASTPTASASPPAPTDLAAHRSRRRGRLAALGLAAAAAALWLFIISPSGHVFKDMAHETGEPEATPLASAPPPSAPPAPRPHLRLLEGDAAAGPPLPAGATLPVGPLALADRACVGAAAHLRACAEGQVLLEIVGDDALALERGRLRVDLADPILYRFVVAGVSITSEAPAAFVLIADTGRWELHVERGELRLTEPNGDARTLGAGQRERHPASPADDITTTTAAADDPTTTADDPTATDDAPTAADRPAARPRPASDPAALLAEANALRGAGDPRAAAAVYRRLVREHQGTSLARTAQVTLGQLYLGPLADPRAALAAFDAYLRAAPQGALAEEALRGRIDALRRLGRDRPAAEAAAEFLRRFPRSRHADEIRALLD